MTIGPVLLLRTQIYGEAQQLLPSDKESSNVMGLPDQPTYDVTQQSLKTIFSVSIRGTPRAKRVADLND
jgi:hypothetical protein